MEKIQINGKNIISGMIRRYGDASIIAGIRADDAKVIFVSGRMMASGPYQKIIEAAVCFNEVHGHKLKLYLDIPMFVRDTLKRWMRRHDIDDLVAFSEADKVGEKFPENGGFEDRIIAEYGLDGCYAVPSRGEVIPGTITDLLKYFEDRYGE